LRTSPEALVGEVQAKGIEDDLFLVPHTAPKRYGNFTDGL
jgi:hypothetical protein